MLRHVLDEREEAPLGVVPRLRAESHLVRLETLDDPRYSELVVALGAIESPVHSRTSIPVTRSVHKQLTDQRV